MANRYWVGGSGTWNTGTANWSSSSGGPGGASAPTTADIAIFDSNSNNGNLGADYTVVLSGVSPQILNGTSVSPPYAGNVTLTNSGSSQFKNLTTSGTGCIFNWGAQQITLTGTCSVPAGSTFTAATISLLNFTLGADCHFETCTGGVNLGTTTLVGNGFMLYAFKYTSAATTYDSTAGSINVTCTGNTSGIIILQYSGTPVLTGGVPNFIINGIPTATTNTRTVVVSNSTGVTSLAPNISFYNVTDVVSISAGGYFNEYYIDASCTSTTAIGGSSTYAIGGNYTIQAPALTSTGPRTFSSTGTPRTVQTTGISGALTFSGSSTADYTVTSTTGTFAAGSINVTNVRSVTFNGNVTTTSTFGTNNGTIGTTITVNGNITVGTVLSMNGSSGSNSSMIFFGTVTVTGNFTLGGTNNAMLFSGGNVTLSGSAFSAGGTNTSITLTNSNVTFTNVSLSSVIGSGTTLNLNDNTWNCTSGFSATAGSTINGGTGTINMTTGSSFSVASTTSSMSTMTVRGTVTGLNLLFTGAGIVIGTVLLSDAAHASLTMAGTVTINNIIYPPTLTAAASLRLSNGSSAIYTIGNLVNFGSGAFTTTVSASGSFGTQSTINYTGTAPILAQNVSVSDSKILQTNKFYGLPPNSVNVINNTNWIFGYPANNNFTQFLPLMF